MLLLASTGAAFTKTFGLVMTFFVIIPAIVTGLIVVAVAVARGERHENERYREARAERLVD